ncbi:MAG: phosphoenolpyruvate carboxylase, partial [Psychrobacter sp.]|nr:phosphoenolpyruvate carboxylase [Psychrobacter sp.]
WRNAYLDPINYIQIELLKRARQKGDEQSHESNKSNIDVEDPLIRSINALAAGLRNTG